MIISLMKPDFIEDHVDNDTNDEDDKGKQR